MSTATGYGKPKYGNSNSKQWKTFKLKTGGNVYRILPPMKSMADAGQWAKYYGLHWGYSGLDFKDKTKTRQKPFMCISDKDRDGMIKRRCLECEAIEAKEALLKELEAGILSDLKTKGITDQNVIDVAVKDGTQLLRDYLKAHSCDRKWYMNVKTPQGEYGVLLLSHRTKKKLEAKIQELLNTEQIDALDPATGVWFNFQRVGEKIQADDTVEVVKDFIDIGGGRKAQVNRSGALSQQELDDGLAQCPDLNEVVRRITADQIQLLVNCSGDPEEVDKIFSLSVKREQSPVPEAPAKTFVPTTPPPGMEVRTVPEPQPAAPTPSPAATPAPAAAPVVDVAVLQAQMAALQAQILAAATPAPVVQAAAPAPVTPPAQTAPTTAPVLTSGKTLEELAALPPAQFLAQFKLNN